MKVYGQESEIYGDIDVFGEDAKDVLIELNNFVAELEEKGECCIDSLRVAEAMDKASMEAYDTLISCCGSSDIGREINGTLYMMGANFGH